MQNIRSYVIGCVEQAAGDTISPEHAWLRFAVARAVFWSVVLGVIGRPLTH